MHNPVRKNILRFLAIFGPVWHLAAQAPAGGKPQPDVLILMDGEQLQGHFEGSSGTSIVFNSDSVGEVKPDWSKVKELHTQGQYAVVPKTVQLRRHMDTAGVPQGKLDMTDQRITITPATGAPRTVAVADAAQVFEEATFQKQVEPPPVPFTKDWTGTITGGGSLVEATQQSITLTGAVHLVRAIPLETTFPPQNRTVIDFIGSEGHVTQPGTPEIRTEIAHFDGERDEYFTQSGVYAFVLVAYDHNYSQGLTLQQTYSAGIGWTAIRDPNETLDVKGGVTYEHQQFSNAFFTATNTTPTPDLNLIGSTFAENFTRKFNKGATFTQNFTATPAWNNLNAWLAAAGAAINLPVYKNFSFTLAVTDNFLNNPPPGFRKNSFQATTALTYTVK
jgi:Protein of unknown function, DUF481